MRTRSAVIKQSVDRPKQNTVTDVKLKSLQNPSQGGNVAPKMKVQPILELAKGKPTFAQEETKIDQLIYDQLDPGNDQEDRSKSNINCKYKIENQNYQLTKTRKKRDIAWLSKWFSQKMQHTNRLKRTYLKIN